MRASSASTPANGAPPRARACLLSTCGLPGAGKSTLTCALAAHLDRDGPGGSLGVRVTRVAFDDIERRLASERAASSSDPDPDAPAPAPAGFHPALWRAARAEAFAALERALADDPNDPRPHLVVADDNFYYAGMRYQCHLLARRAAAAHVQLYLPVDLDLAHARNAARHPSEVVPRDALDRMADAIEPPDGDRRAFERDAVVIVSPRAEADDAHTSAVWDRIWTTWGGAAIEPESVEEAAARRAEGSAANARSAAHALDIRSRKALGSAMASAAASGMDGAARGKLSARLNEARRVMLEAVREAARRVERDGDDGEGEGTDDAEADFAFAATATAREAEFAEACRVAAKGE